MASTTDHTIFLSGGVPFAVESRIQEGLGAGTVTPGHIVEFSTAEAIVVHPTGTGVWSRMIAIENPYDDLNTSPAIDSNYLTDDTVRFIYAIPGDLCYLWLANGETAVRGRSRLASNGDGTLRVVTTGTPDLSIVGVPHEDLANATGAAARLRVRIL